MMERITRKVETPEMDSQPLEMMSPFILNSLAHFNNLIKLLWQSLVLAYPPPTVSRTRFPHNRLIF